LDFVSVVSNKHLSALPLGTRDSNCQQPNNTFLWKALEAEVFKNSNFLNFGKKLIIRSGEIILIFQIHELIFGKWLNMKNKEYVNFLLQQIHTHLE
jgi:hypothetical protein